MSCVLSCIFSVTGERNDSIIFFRLQFLALISNTMAYNVKCIAFVSQQIYFSVSVLGNERKLYGEQLAIYGGQVIYCSFERKSLISILDSTGENL